MRLLAALALTAAAVLPLAAAAAPGPHADALAGWTQPGQPPAIADIWDIVHGPGHPPGRRGTPPPLKPEYAARLKAYLAQGPHSSQTANCIPPGMPQVMDVPYPIEILFAPGKIVIIEEGYMQVRHVHADGRAHPDDPDLTFNEIARQAFTQATALLRAGSGMDESAWWRQFNRSLEPLPAWTATPH